MCSGNGARGAAHSSRHNPGSAAGSAHRAGTASVQQHTRGSQREKPTMACVKEMRRERAPARHPNVRSTAQHASKRQLHAPNAHWRQRRCARGAAVAVRRIGQHKGPCTMQRASLHGMARTKVPGLHKQHSVMRACSWTSIKVKEAPGRAKVSSCPRTRATHARKARARARAHPQHPRTTPACPQPSTAHMRCTNHVQRVCGANKTSASILCMHTPAATHNRAASERPSVPASPPLHTILPSTRVRRQQRHTVHVRGREREAAPRKQAVHASPTATMPGQPTRTTAMRVSASRWDAAEPHAAHCAALQQAAYCSDTGAHTRGGARTCWRANATPWCRHRAGKAARQRNTHTHTRTKQGPE